jgi:hypothetical protein
LIFVTEVQSVFCEIEIEYLKSVQMNFTLQTVNSIEIFFKMNILYIAVRLSECFSSLNTKRMSVNSLLTIRAESFQTSLVLTRIDQM